VKNTTNSITLISYQAKAEYWVLIGLTNPEQLSVLTEQLNSEYPGYILVDRLEKLHDFISPIPDLAWDIMEDSEKRLVIEFDSIKPQWQHLAQNGRLAVMLNKVEELNRPLQQNRGMLWCQPVDMDELESVTPDLEVNGNKKLDPERKFWLGADSQIKVLQ
jgi:hypothetical protein